MSIENPTKADYKRLIDEKTIIIIKLENDVRDARAGEEEQRQLRERWQLLTKETQDNYNALLANYGALQLEIEFLKKTKLPDNGGLIGFADV